MHVDLSSLIALSFNRRVQSDSLTNAQKQKIMSALYAALPVDDPHAQAQAELIIAVMPLLSSSFGFNLSQLQQFTRPKRKIKVAVLLEPTVLGFIDLLGPFSISRR